MAKDLLVPQFLRPEHYAKPIGFETDQIVRLSPQLVTCSGQAIRYLYGVDTI